MTIIIFMLFMFVVVTMESMYRKANEEHYLSRFINKANIICTKAKNVCIIAYASVLYWTGVI